MVNFMAEITDAPKVIGELKNLKNKMKCAPYIMKHRVHQDYKLFKLFNIDVCFLGFERLGAL